MHWGETLDGYTLLKDDKGYWVFAQTDKSGRLIASDLRYEGNSMKAKANGLQPGLHFSSRQVRSMRKSTQDHSDLTIDGTFPATGKRKLLVLLVNYSDTHPTYTQNDFYRMMNQKGFEGIGSFRDYYLEQSYGKLDIDVTVTDWITLPTTKAIYGSEGAPYMIEDALSLVADTLDLKQFDNDGDGILDGLAVIHQGTGQEMSGDASEIWSHSSIIYGLKYNGVSVRRYTIEPECLALGNRMSTIGVICHEFGHNLGAPDFYDTDYAQSGGEYCGTGVWDLLGSGAWNGDYGTRPAGINAWQKWVLGWTEPVALENDTIVADMPSADKQPIAYRMETGNPGEYYLMENRQQSGAFDAALPGHGLVVYHVNENTIKTKLTTNDINATFPQGIYTVCSDAAVDPESHPSSYGNVNSASAPFPGDYQHTEFSDSTLPSTKSQDGRSAYRALKNITEEDGQVGFQFVHSEEPAKPINLHASTQNGNVTLTWDLSATDEPIDHYTIYRNNASVATSSTTTFTDEAPTSGTVLTYQVDVTYQNGLVSHPASVQIMVPDNRVTSLDASTDGDKVNLTWTTDNVLKRIDLTTSTLTAVDIYGEEVEYANRYTAADLATYVGGKISKMGFLPVQGPSELTVKFRVWEADADGGTSTMVSERSVKEFANGQVREVKLTTPVTIKANKDYWVSVNCVGSKGVVTPVCDKSPIVKGRGNCLLKGGNFVESEEATGNFYITATVTPPAATQGTEVIPQPDETCDPTLDLYYPKAYAVYCDGELLGCTTARSKVITAAPDGLHTYSVSSYYKGGNVSLGVSKDVEIVTNGIASLPVSSERVKSSEGQIVFAGYEGQVVVADVFGRQVLSTTVHANEAIKLLPGVYTVSLLQDKGQPTVKICVR